MEPVILPTGIDGNLRDSSDFAEKIFAMPLLPPIRGGSVPFVCFFLLPPSFPFRTPGVRVSLHFTHGLAF